MHTQTLKPLFGALLLGGLITAGIFYLGDGTDGANNKNAQTNIFKPLESTDPDIVATYNSFVEEHGIFRFDYNPAYEVKRLDNLYYLAHLMNGEAVAYFFVDDGTVQFVPDDYACIPGDSTVCIPRTQHPEYFVNFSVSPVEAWYSDALAHFRLRGLVSNAFPYDRLSRADALEFILRMRYPTKDFSSYRGDCFADIENDHPQSGFICFAKEEKIIDGIDNHFFPDLRIDLLGALKLVYRIHGIDYQNYVRPAVNLELFSDISPVHADFPLIAKGYFDGLFDNLDNDMFWSGKEISFGEFLVMMHRFTLMQSGKTLKNYEPPRLESADGNGTGGPGALYVRDPNLMLQFKEIEDEDDADFLKEPARKSVRVQNGDDIDIYIQTHDAVFQYFYTLPRTAKADIVAVNAYFNGERLRGGLVIQFADGSKKMLEIDIGKEQFAPLKERVMQTKNERARAELAARQLLPLEAPEPQRATMPTMRLSLPEDDLVNLMENRTSTRRYPAYLEMRYPDGTTENRSVLIKTRGNTTRGYIKASYTIEAFSSFDEQKNFIGDEFLKGADEIKLRARTSGKEMAFYAAFQALGYPAPDSMYALVNVNGMDIGVYQVTEDTQKEFFKRRGINPAVTVYARTTNSPVYDTNLQYYTDDATTIAPYEIDGSPELLLALIRELASNNRAPLEHLNVQNILDYALLAYVTGAYDSLAHNYYLYFDSTARAWNIFPWDADTCCEAHPPYTLAAFKEYLRRTSGPSNALFAYLERVLTDYELQTAMNHFKTRFTSVQEKMDLHFADALSNYSAHFDFNNLIWNDLVFDRTGESKFDRQAHKELRQFYADIF